MALSLLAAVSYASANCCVRALKDAETIEIQFFNDTVSSWALLKEANTLTLKYSLICLDSLGFFEHVVSNFGGFPTV